jgi:ABC-type antimicrobial peptide transport system permease subunit
MSLLVAAVIFLLVGALIGVLFAYFLLKKTSRPLTVTESEKVNLEDAGKVLKAAGFVILESPAKRSLMTIVDGRNYFGEAVADFLVKKEKKTYAVKIQTSPVLDFTEPTFRRLLLECEYAFGPDGLITFDPQTKEIHHVNFSSPKKSLQEIIFQYLIIGFIILVIVGIIGLLISLKLY